MPLSNDRFSKLLEALELERKQEENYFRNLSDNKTIQEKVGSGVMWYPVNINSTKYTIGEFLELEIERTKNADLPHKLKSDMRARVFQIGKEAKDYSGTISFVKRNRLGVILTNDSILKDNASLNGHYGVELLYDERPYIVMRGAVNKLRISKEPHLIELREGVKLKKKLDYTSETDYHFNDKKLNASQNKAVNGALRAQQMCIIHGPPGTGKTTTLVAIIKSLAKMDEKVLVCASSNNAVDLLTRQLHQAGVTSLRIGNVTRIGDSIAHLTLAEKARMHADWAKIKKVKIAASEAKRQAKTFKRTFGSQERSFRNDMYKESRDLINWAKDLEEKLTDQILNEAQAICTTLIGVSNKVLAGIVFDTVVIDEASQALEPECWNAIIHAKKVILAGDHFQLPPTVKSNEAKKMGLDTTLLDLMTDTISHSYLLTVQYRMNQRILQFSNENFYDGRLVSDPSVADHTLEKDDQPLMFIDTSGCGFDEIQDPKTLSRYNEGEYGIIREHLLKHPALYQEGEIGIISPYAQQVRYVRTQISADPDLKSMNIEVDSIDGFQGQEKDIIFISLVRSNTTGEIGFLKDFRRLNVALTRARKKLIVVGDGATIASEKLYVSLMEHIEKHGTYQSAWEYMA